MILNYDAILNIFNFLDDNEVRRILTFDIHPLFNTVVLDIVKGMDTVGYSHPINEKNKWSKPSYKTNNQIVDKTIPFNGREYIWYERNN